MLSNLANYVVNKHIIKCIENYMDGFPVSTALKISKEKAYVLCLCHDTNIKYALKYSR